MKILLTNFHPSNGGGHTTYLKYLFQEFNKNDKVDICIACPEGSRLYKVCSEINQNNTFAIDFPSKISELSSVYKNTKILAALIKKYNFDIVHVNGNPEHKMAMYCKLFYNLNFKIVRTKHESKNIKNNFFTTIQYKYFMDKMIVVSNYQLNSINKKFILDKTIMIHNGVDLNYFKPKEKNQELIDKYKISTNDIVFVSVAGTALHKGWQHLVKAIAELDDNLKNKIKIIIAGNPPKEKIYEKYIKSNFMENHVVFTGLVDDVRDIISIGDIGFVLSTSIETISFACREMMAMGKPVIASDYAGLPENIDNNLDGWIINTKESDYLKKVIKDIVNNKNMVDNMSKHAKNKAYKEFSLDDFANKTLKIYEKIL